MKYPERMWEVKTFVDLHGVAAPKSDRCAGEIAEAVDGNTRGFVKPRNQEGRSKGRDMMFDVMDLCFERIPVGFFKLFLDGRRAPQITVLLVHQAPAASIRQSESMPTPVTYAGLS